MAAATELVASRLAARMMEALGGGILRTVPWAITAQRHDGGSHGGANGENGNLCFGMQN